ncbi:MAG: DciA family protein [Devosiaceae bacterium]|nr:DciA family protein [Devosiaceae bacterium]
MKTPSGAKNIKTKRGGRARGVGELVGKLIDPALKKRGFASRDILENWQIIAPPPYNRTTIPDRLKWPRNKSGSDGALLYLRCIEGERMALSHDHERITEAVNRYFGYVLVQAIKLSTQPFPKQSGADSGNGTSGGVQMNVDPETGNKIKKLVQGVEDEELKQALHKLGQGVFNKNKK